MPIEHLPNTNLILEATAFNIEQIDSRLSILAERGEAHIALAGRSNVGKSSLINALAGRKTLAKTSSTPGKTRSANFYHATYSNVSFSIVDLPGYGYAQCSQAERNAWARLIDHYLSDSSNLRAVVLLLDCRLEPQKLDKDLADFVRNRNLHLFPVLTKADKCKQVEQSMRRKQWSVILNGTIPLVVSSANGRGIHDLWRSMSELCQDTTNSPESQTTF